MPNHARPFDAIDMGAIDAIFAVEKRSLIELARAAGRDPATFFQGRNFRGLSLAGVDLRGVSLAGADLRGCLVRDAITDETTDFGAAVIDEEDAEWRLARERAGDE